MNDAILANRTQGRTPDPLRLARRDRADWQAALTDGQLDRMTAEQGVSLSAGFLTTTGFRVVFDNDGRTEIVTVTVSMDFDGDVYTICSCAIGRTMRPCPHAAIAVDSAGLWPFPVARQTSFVE